MNNGRTRLKIIRSIARGGPVAAYTRWERREDNLRKATESGFPENILSWYRSLEHDARYAVRVAKPVGPGRLEVNNRRMVLARNILAERGTEMTQDEVITSMHEIAAHFRAWLSAKGYPMPDNDEALLELTRWMAGGGK